MIKRCDVCRRFKTYEEDDRFCLLCGSDALSDRCACGRPFDYATPESGDLFCPRCGQIVRGRATEFEA
jgi:rRNA maturation endonuclease Nob1